MKTIVFYLLFLGVIVSFAEMEIIHNPDPSSLDMTVRTDKASYFACEPVTVIVSLVNKTDKTICLPFAKYDQWLNDYTLTVQTPVNTAQIAWEEGDAKKLEKRTARSAPLLRYHKINYFWGGDKGVLISPHDTYNFKIPLSRCFDLSFPPGEYVVTVNRAVGAILDDTRSDYPSYKSCYASASTSFNLKREHISSHRISFENMRQIFGREKTIGMLCDEAVDILSELEKMEENKAVNSNAYQRLSMILRTLDDVVDFNFSKINRSFIWEEGQLNLEKTRRFLEHSRGHLKQ